MRLGLETESCHLRFQQSGMSIFSFIDLTAELGLEGVQINVIPDFGLHPQWGTLDGNDPSYLAEVRAAIDARDFYCEIDSRGTTVEELEPVLRVAETLGATLVRSYIRYPAGEFDGDFMAAQVREVRQVISVLKEYGIRLAFENHEFETSGDMIDFVHAIGDPDWVGLLCDIGNSMMAWEEPTTAVKAMAPYTFGVHFKDHIVVANAASGRGNDQRVVCGVPLRHGSIDLTTIYRILVEESRAANMNLEVCYPYCATFKRPEGTGGADGSSGTFALAEPPFAENLIRPMQYYYPHEVGADICKMLITRQTDDLWFSAAVFKGLRNEYAAHR